MSFFYLLPVKGDMPVHLLETVVNGRLEYLKAILRDEPIVYNEYVVEGSIYDNVGHFMLCVVAVLSESWGITQFVSKIEQELFRRRINFISAYNLRLFSKKLLRSIKKLDYTPPYTDPLAILCRHLMLKDLAQHVCAALHTSDCTLHTISFNFKHCLTFVARRQIELKNGQAYLPCGKWKQYLCDLFSKNLKHKMQKRLPSLKGDTRVMEILTKIKRSFPVISNNSMELLSKDVDLASRLFPPCMLNLHQYLRKKHRLSHTQRFYYSLFLKDIGMPVEEAVEFWRAEYKQIANSHNCCHNWERDEKKYLYGIRHMYGLEGCRKNYTSVSCQHIQSSDTSCSEGGCPFKSFDIQKMSQLLNNKSQVTDSEFSQIIELKRKGQYTSACALYQTQSHKTTCDTSFNFTPVKYYISASKSKLI